MSRIIISGEAPVWAHDMVREMNTVFATISTPLQYRVADLPPAKPDGAIVYVSDEVGGPVLAFASNGVWLRSTDRAEVS